MCKFVKLKLETLSLYLLCFCKIQDALLVGRVNLTFYKYKADFELASAFCRQSNSSLVAIKNEAIQSAISEKLWQAVDFFSNAEDSAGYWTSGRRNVGDGNWHWFDGAIVPTPENNVTGFMKWFIYLWKDELSVPSCLMLLPRNIYSVDANDTGMWIGAPCDSRRYFICQKDVESFQESEIVDTKLWIPITIATATLLFVVFILCGIILKLFCRLRSKTRLRASKVEAVNRFSAYQMADSSTANSSFRVQTECKQRPRGESNIYMEVDTNSSTEQCFERNSPYLEMRPCSVHTIT